MLLRHGKFKPESDVPYNNMAIILSLVLPFVGKSGGGKSGLGTEPQGPGRAGGLAHGDGGKHAQGSSSFHQGFLDRARGYQLRWR